ncbi:MAG: CHAT domain-containing tetratricopeptide repeat protein, partial [Synechococcus sp.]|nr:CHAT domain-containing tetratricopeptide repeat protein [Synechococcus sp.]
MAQAPPAPATRTDPQLQELIQRADALEARGAYAEAEPLRQQILAITEKTQGPQQLDTATSLNNLAGLYRALGRYGEAELLYKRSLAIREKLLGLEHRDTASSLDNLAGLYRAQGRYGEAELLYKRSLAIREKLLGLKHRDTASSLNNLAGLYRAQGRYGEAELLYKRSLAIREKLLGLKHRDTASSLNNLAGLYRALGRYGEAELFYKRSLAIRELLLGPNHLLVASSLNNLAGLYRAQSRYREASLFYGRSLAIREILLGAWHPLIASSYNNLAGLYRDSGHYGEAELHYKRSLQIRDRILGSEHPLTISSLNNLARLYLLQGNTVASKLLLQRLNRDQLGWLQRELPLQPRDLRGSLLGQQPDASASTFALLDQSPAAAPLALEMRLNRQGLLAEIERRQALLRGSSPETRRLAEQVAGIDRLLASVTLPTAQREPLRQQRQQLEAQLYRLLPALRIEGVSNAQVAAALRAAAPQGLLVEFQKYRPYGKNGKGRAEWGAERYVALLLQPDGRVSAIELGEAASIDALVARALELSERKRLDVEEPLQALRERLLEPLRQELAGVRELFVSPDGELNRLPFAALPMPGQSGRLLSEALQLRLLSSGRDLVRLQQPGRAGGPAALVADPQFTPGAVTPVCDPRDSGPVRQAGLWQPLPCTALEARQLMPLLQVPRPLTGVHASVANVVAAQRPRILHIASHGFFWSEAEAREQATTCSPAGGSAAPAAKAQVSPSSSTVPGPSGAASRAAVARPQPGTSTGAGGPSLIQSFEALQRSGIVLAGANQPCRAPEQDGYLTAAEVTGMDLEGTELTTLSACQTG